MGTARQGLREKLYSLLVSLIEFRNSFIVALLVRCMLQGQRIQGVLLDDRDIVDVIEKSYLQVCLRTGGNVSSTTVVHVPSVCLYDCMILEQESVLHVQVALYLRP